MSQPHQSEEATMKTESLSKDDLRRLHSHLWACLLDARARPEARGIPAWDVPLTPKKDRRTKYVAVKCGRCNGVGAIACFTATYSGKCFACGGSGHRFISEAAYKKQKALRKAAQ